MKHILLILSLLITSSVIAQDKDSFFTSVYKDFLKYGTVYAAGDISNAVEAQEPTYVLRTNQDGSIYSIPDIEDVTDRFPFDYRYSIGII